MKSPSYHVILKSLHVDRFFKVRLLTGAIDLWYDNSRKGFEEWKVFLATGPKSIEVSKRGFSKGMNRELDQDESSG